MEVWILFVFFKMGYGAGLTSAEFSSKERCEAAMVQIRKHGEFASDWTICVRK